MSTARTLGDRGRSDLQTEDGGEESLVGPALRGASPAFPEDQTVTHIRRIPNGAAHDTDATLVMKDIVKFHS